MPYPLDTDTEADIAAGRVRPCDLVDFYVRDGVGDPDTLRCWNWPGEAVYPGTADLDGSTDDVTYESLYGRIAVPKGLRTSATLASEPMVITLDGSRSDDDADWVGRFVDSDWHQCRVRVRQVLMHFETGAHRDQPAWEWRGLLNHRDLVLKDGDASVWNVTCEGGLFRIRGRRLRSRTHEDQQRRSAGDQFYKGTAVMVGLPLNWAKAPASIPGVITNGGGAAYAPPITNIQNRELQD